MGIQPLTNVKQAPPVENEVFKIAEVGLLIA